MNRKIFFIILLMVSVAGIIAYFTFVKESVPYASKEKCEQATGRECYLFRGMCQVGEAQTPVEAEENEKFLKECLPKIGTWQPVESTIQPANEISDWETYHNNQSGFEFRYPEKLKLSIEGSKVILNHSIPYENYGDCDMLGDEQLYQTLDDFNVSLEVVNKELSLPYVDGEYSAGTLKGSWAYEGAEGCGYSTYHFSIGKNKTLVVQRATIQALSGLSTLWDSEKILAVPGVISKEESNKLFNEIISTFKLVQ